MASIIEINQRVRQKQREERIYRLYSRGQIDWAEGIDRLLQLGVDEIRAIRILLGTD